jgi:hypothetical protein
MSTYLNSASVGAFVMVSDDGAGNYFVLHFDRVENESWSLGVETPEFAVANAKVNTQRIVDNEKFRVSLEVTEIPSHEQVFTNLGALTGPDELNSVVVPYDVFGEARVFLVRDALQARIADVFTLYTERNGKLDRMVIQQLDINFDGPRRVAKFSISFTQFNAANIESIAVQVRVRAKKAAAEEVDFGECSTDVAGAGEGAVQDISILQRMQYGAGSQATYDTATSVFQETLMGLGGIFTGVTP